MRSAKNLPMMKRTEDNFLKIKTGTKQGLAKGWKGFIWLLKIIIPISFATNLLVHFGIIYKLDFVLTPIMTLMGLPASAALVLIMGFFTGIYGTVAALSSMPFCTEHMILIAIFCLISHNMIQESIVQGNSGINPFFAGFFRLFMSLVVTFICAKIMGVTPETGSQIISQTGLDQNTTSFGIMFKNWGVRTVKLTLQIFCIIMPLMITLELAKIFNIINLITKMISPLLKIMGLNPSTGMLWLTATVFGLTYGAAVIVEETQSKKFKQQDLNKLHLSLGINHAMIEDPILFLPFGLPLFWLWIPRLLAAIAATWIYSFFLFSRRLYVKHSIHKKLCNHR